MGGDMGQFWQSVKSLFVWTETELTHLKNLTIFGAISALVVAYFQYRSAYQDRVATLAQEDLTAATQTLSEISTALSTAVSLQRRLISDFYAATPGNYMIDDAYPTSDARAIYKDYMDTYSSLHQNYNLLARKAEIYLDWPSDVTHDAAKNTTPTVDPINMSLLGTAGFNCEDSMPSFEKDKQRVPIKDPANGKTYFIDWRSALHNVLTIQYCFDVTHQKMKAALEWASKSKIDAEDWKFMTSHDGPDIPTLFNKTRATNQAQRLNYFLTLAMSEIEAIRVNYRPDGIICGVPVLSGMISLTGRMLDRAGPNWCTPVRTSTF